VHGYSPNVVASALETGLNRSCGVTRHALKVSSGMGIWGRMEISTGLARPDARPMAYLVTARVPKYTAMNLFLRVNAYTLRRNCISRLRGKDGHSVPQRNEDIRKQ